MAAQMVRHEALDEIVAVVVFGVATHHHILAGGLAAEMPVFIGGDRAKAEALFKRALEVDPHFTGGRIELARLYIASRRWGEAQRELQSVVNETAATDLPRWTVSDRPRARAMLADLRDRGRIPGVPSQSP